MEGGSAMAGKEHYSCHPGIGQAPHVKFFLEGTRRVVTSSNNYAQDMKKPTPFFDPIPQTWTYYWCLGTRRALALQRFLNLLAKTLFNKWILQSDPTRTPRLTKHGSGLIMGSGMGRYVQGDWKHSLAEESKESSKSSRVLATPESGTIWIHCSLNNLVEEVNWIQGPMESTSSEHSFIVNWEVK